MTPVQITSVITIILLSVFVVLFFIETSDFVNKKFLKTITTFRKFDSILSVIAFIALFFFAVLEGYFDSIPA